MSVDKGIFIDRLGQSLEHPFELYPLLQFVFKQLFCLINFHSIVFVYECGAQGNADALLCWLSDQYSLEKYTFSAVRRQGHSGPNCIMMELKLLCLACPILLNEKAIQIVVHLNQYGVISSCINKER